MKRIIFLSTACLAAAACSEPAAPALEQAGAPALARADAPSAIEGRWIVVLRDDAADVPGLARRLTAAHGGSLRHTYEHVIKGFAVELPAAAVAALERNPEVAYVEADQEMLAIATQSMSSAGDPWGLDRIDQRARPLSWTYTYTRTGSGVRAYIIDTGIETSHTQFGGRASNVYDAFGSNGQDCNGHGTHVAGTVGGSTWGVAKAVMLRGVRVLDCGGSGSTSGIIAALDWVRVNHIKPAVANMSLGGGYSSALNTAVTNLSNAGVFVAVAAGNESQNACNVSPASAATVTTVAASSNTDARASFSNYGSCVDLYAPGVKIASSYIGGRNVYLDGTSMASPHVAGVAALYKATYGDVSSGTIDSWLKTNATANVITGNPTGTPNRLLYKAGL